MRIKPKRTELETTRLKRGYSRLDIAKKAKISPMMVTNIEEKGNYYPNAGMAKKICDILDTDFDSVFEIV